jgi:hypothetical protein
LVIVNKLVSRTGTLLGLAAFLMVVSGERAEAQLNIIPRFRVKAGVFLPQNTSLKNAVGNTWLKVGADVNLPASLFPLGSTRIGIDYVVNGSSNIVPITITQIFQPSVAVRSPVYAGAGIGLWTGHIKGSGTSTQFGFRLLAGIEFSDRLFGEVQYDFVDKLGGARADGLSVLVGLKF